MLWQETLSQQILSPPSGTEIIYCEQVLCKSLFLPAITCHAFIDVSSSFWKRNGVSQTSYSFWIDNRGQIRYKLYYRLWFNPFMANFGLTMKGKSQGLIAEVELSSRNERD